jgi:hypothetical protein
LENTVPVIDGKEIERRFRYHAPTDETRVVHDTVREEMLAFAFLMNDLLPGESREKSLFFTELENASYQAHAHIARNMQ